MKHSSHCRDDGAYICEVEGLGRFQLISPLYAAQTDRSRLEHQCLVLSQLFQLSHSSCLVCVSVLLKCLSKWLQAPHFLSIRSLACRHHVKAAALKSAVLFYVPAAVGAVSGIVLWGGLVSEGSSLSLLQTDRQWQAKLLPQRRPKPKLPANGGAASASSLHCLLQLWPQHLPEVCMGINQ